MGNAPRTTQVTEIVTIRNHRPQQMQTTSISMVPEIDLEVHIQKNSFKITTEKGSSYLTFNFDSSHICLITVYYFGVEVLSKKEDHTMYFAVDTEKYPAPNSYKFPSGLNQKFPEKVSEINLNRYASDIASSESHNQYPIIITIKPENTIPFPYESSFLRIDKEKDIWKPVLLKQKIHFDGSSYYLSEIYGLSSLEDDKNVCIVCLTGKSKVTMMPCKHLCLCEECAQVLSESAVKKCPMCRACVNELLFIAK
ncbi:hypothetical protein SteCoe_18221 [Stentor coeruleus]|uniref:RING-type E3 ubiquitin transferase n=1 Tax=Stentor coeruleus TaxID=5963 RepID=A0A1R2BX65_9CILI|nr:hypothetical protein SteCoe_18221 [Stentor coeruleus]